MGTNRHWAHLAALTPFAVTAGAMIATPLARRGNRAGLATAVVSGLAATTLVATNRRWGARRAVTAGAIVATATTVVEHLGASTGVPFGRYAYTGALRPQVVGVPIIVPLAWFAMAVPARESAAALVRTPLARVGLGAALLTAWDLFLDPQMVGEDYWRWARHGAYRGIPLSNFAGWFLTGAAVLAALEVLLPADEVAGADETLVALYAWMAVMQTLGFAAFFRDPLVAVVGGAAMLPPALIALRRTMAARHG